MADYRIPELDLSTRFQLAVEMLLPIPLRKWGRASQLSQTFGISRTLLYKMRDQAKDGLLEALTPRQPGPKPHREELVIDKDFLPHAIGVLSLLKGTVRDIQIGLELLFGVHRSIGFISQTLQEIGQKASAYHLGISIRSPVMGEADEIFQGGKPCLTVVDGRSFLVLHLSPAEARDETNWGLAFLELQEQGIQFQDIACEGARGIKAGVKQAQLAIPLRSDLFHLIREAHKITKKLEREGYRAIEVAEHARRAEREAKAPKRRRGRPLKVRVPLHQAEKEEEKAIERYDCWVWLMEEARKALEPFTPEGRLNSLAEARATLESAITLMKELGHNSVTTFAIKLQSHLDELLAPIGWRSSSPLGGKV